MHCQRTCANCIQITASGRRSPHIRLRRNEQSKPPDSSSSAGEDGETLLVATAATPLSLTTSSRRSSSTASARTWSEWSIRGPPSPRTSLHASPTATTQCRTEQSSPPDTITYCPPSNPLLGGCIQARVPTLAACTGSSREDTSDTAAPLFASLDSSEIVHGEIAVSNARGLQTQGVTRSESSSTWPSSNPTTRCRNLVAAAATASSILLLLLAMRGSGSHTIDVGERRDVLMHPNNESELPLRSDSASLSLAPPTSQMAIVQSEPPVASRKRSLGEMVVCASCLCGVTSMHVIRPACAGTVSAGDSVSTAPDRTAESGAVIHSASLTEGESATGEGGERSMQIHY